MDPVGTPRSSANASLIAPGRESGNENNGRTDSVYDRNTGAATLRSGSGWPQPQPGLQTTAHMGRLRNVMAPVEDLSATHPLDLPPEIMALILSYLPPATLRTLQYELRLLADDEATALSEDRKDRLRALLQEVEFTLEPWLPEAPSYLPKPEMPAYVPHPCDPAYFSRRRDLAGRVVAGSLAAFGLPTLPGSVLLAFVDQKRFQQNRRARRREYEQAARPWNEENRLQEEQHRRTSPGSVLRAFVGRKRFEQKRRTRRREYEQAVRRLNEEDRLQEEQDRRTFEERRPMYLRAIKELWNSRSIKLSKQLLGPGEANGDQLRALFLEADGVPDREHAAANGQAHVEPLPVGAQTLTESMFQSDDPNVWMRCLRSVEHMNARSIDGFIERLRALEEASADCPMWKAALIPVGPERPGDSGIRVAEAMTELSALAPERRKREVEGLRNLRKELAAKPRQFQSQRSVIEYLDAVCGSDDDRCILSRDAGIFLLQGNDHIPIICRTRPAALSGCYPGVRSGIRAWDDWQKFFGNGEGRPANAGFLVEALVTGDDLAANVRSGIYDRSRGGASPHRNLFMAVAQLARFCTAFDRRKQRRVINPIHEWLAVAPNTGPAAGPNAGPDSWREPAIKMLLRNASLGPRLLRVAAAAALAKENGGDASAISWEIKHAERELLSLASLREKLGFGTKLPADPAALLEVLAGHHHEMTDEEYTEVLTAWVFLQRDPPPKVPDATRCEKLGHGMNLWYSHLANHPRENQPLTEEMISLQVVKRGATRPTVSKLRKLIEATEDRGARQRLHGHLDVVIETYGLRISRCEPLVRRGQYRRAFRKFVNTPRYDRQEWAKFLLKTLPEQRSPADSEFRAVLSAVAMVELEPESYPHAGLAALALSPVPLFLLQKATESRAGVAPLRFVAQLQTIFRTEEQADRWSRSDELIHLIDTADPGLRSVLRKMLGLQIDGTPDPALILALAEIPGLEAAVARSFSTKTIRKRGEQTLV